MLTTCSLLSLKRDFHYYLFQLPRTFCALLISLALLKVISFSVISLINITGNQKLIAHLGCINIRNCSKLHTCAYSHYLIHTKKSLKMKVLSHTFMSYDLL